MWYSSQILFEQKFQKSPMQSKLEQKMANIYFFIIIMRKAQQLVEMSKPTEISIHKPPLKNEVYSSSLLFELFITSYYIFLLISGLNPLNRRIVTYGVLFCIIQCIKNVNLIRDFVDPLSLGIMKNFFKWIHLLIEVNMAYLLLRLIYELQSISTLVLTLHFVINSFKKVKLNSQKRGLDLVKAMNFINPILLYTFAKTLHNDFAELSLIFLILFCANLVITSQLRQLFSMNENDIFGWQEIRENGKKEEFWDKKYALKTIVMACCVCLVIENFLLIFDAIKTQAGLAIVHTLILGVYSEVLYLRKNSSMI